MRIPILFFVFAMTFALPSCVVGRYAQDRGCDLLDIFDFKAGYGGIGLGAKVQASEYVKTGFGFGEVYETVEFYGRRKDRYPMMFYHGLIAGFDGPEMPGYGVDADWDLFFVGNPPAGVAALDRARFGAEFVLPGVNFGFFLNLGQIADFFAGLAGFDPANDDALPIGTPLRIDPLPENPAQKAKTPPTATSAP